MYSLLEMACTLMARVEYIVLCLYSERTFGAQRGVRKVQTEYTACAEYNVKYMEYTWEYSRVQFDNERSRFDNKRSTYPGFAALGGFGRVAPEVR